MYKILYKFASRSRPEKFFKAVENIYINSRTDNYLIWATLDSDDLSMNNENIIDRMKRYDKLYFNFGNSKGKIDAINRDISLLPKFDILINMSDDMVFVVEGFDEIIINDFNNNYDQFLHYNDGNQKGNLSSLSILGYDYFIRDGYIYYNEYKSLWADVEATEVAYMRGKYKYFGDEKIIFRHFHPAWGLTERDAQYDKTESKEMWEYDVDIFRKRRINKYGLKQEEIINSFKYDNL